MTGLAHVVAPIFVPADRPDRFEKAAGSGADAIILDLEDAVAADRKAEARKMLRNDFTDLPVIVRINAVGTPWHEDDLNAVASLPFTAVMVPKVELVETLLPLAAAWTVLPLIETVRGVANARQIAASGHATRLAFGSVDYSADLNCGHLRESLLAARSELVFASRLGGISAPIDGVCLDISNPLTAGDEASYARALGFGGKLVIHPAQAVPVVEAFTPSTKEVEWAERILSHRVDGAVRIDGEMVDEPVRIRARAILARVRIAEASL